MKCLFIINCLDLDIYSVDFYARLSSFRQYFFQFNFHQIHFLYKSTGFNLYLSLNVLAYFLLSLNNDYNY